MNKQPLVNKNSPRQDACFALVMLSGWLVFLWLAYALTLFGIFSFPTILSAGIFSIVLSAFTLHKFRFFLSREFLFVLLVIATFATLYTSLSFQSPTIFTGRDQGSYATAALSLVQSGHIDSSSPVERAFFKIYGFGKALNFPGFAYTQSGNLAPQFPLGYIIWIASVTLLFGLGGFAIANGITLFFALACLWLLLRFHIDNGRLAFIGLLTAIFSFPFFWFPLFTLSENLAWALFLFIALAVTCFLQRQASPIAYIGVWLGGLFLAFTRVEGWIIFAIALLAITLSANGRALQQHYGRFKTITIPLITSTIFAVIHIWFNFPFFRSLLSTLVKKGELLPSSDPASFLSSSQALWSILWLYGLGPTLIIGLLGAIILWRRREWSPLIPLILILPLLFYFVDDHISNDHPWFLRRFAFALWPALFLIALVSIDRLGEFLVNHFHSKRLARSFSPLLFGLLFISQIIIFVSFPPRAEHAGLLKQTTDLGSTFTDRDLVLVDRFASGDPWTMLAGPLSTISHLNTAYIFNPEDLTKLPIANFERTFILIRAEELPSYLNKLPDLVIRDAYKLTSNHIEILPRSEVRFPTWQTDTIYGFIMEYK